MIDDMELARRSIRGFGEMIAELGRWGGCPDSEVRLPDAIGARIASAAHNPWLDAVVVPFDASPPADDPRLPGCIWTVADKVDQGQFVCVALTMRLDRDLSIQYVATESSHRRQGLATRLLFALLRNAHRQGLQTATLQASPDGLKVHDTDRL